MDVVKHTFFQEPLRFHGHDVAAIAEFKSTADAISFAETAEADGIKVFVLDYAVYLVA